MNRSEQLMNIAKKNNGMITSKQVDEHGIHRQYLRELVRRGRLEKTERGVYTVVDSFEDRLFSLQSRFSKGVYSHGTALYLHRMTDRTPLKYTMTFPASYNITNAQNHGVDTYRTNRQFYNIGVDFAKTDNHHIVRVYSVERTLCDIVRGACKMNKEDVVNAFKEYSKRNDKDLNALFKYAVLFKVESRIRKYMEVLI
jgi:predicted transcriptional regulator of viral defense system